MNLPGRGMVAMLGMALDGLWRKKGRGALTMAGIVIGIFALTLIVALGQGMSAMVTDTLATEENLRHIEVAPGLGRPPIDPRTIEITGEMDEQRRARLHRAALMRARDRGHGPGSRPMRIDDAALKKIAAVPHVESVTPFVMDRYVVEFGEHREDTGAYMLGLDPENSRARSRLVAGQWFSEATAREVIVHEYLLYRWGFVTEAAQATVVGQTLEIRPMRGGGIAGISPDMIGMAMMQLGSQLSDEDREELQRIVGKLAAGRQPPPDAPDAPGFDLKIVGVLRDLESTDAFNAIEDGATLRADVFLPQQTAVGIFAASPTFRERGYDRAMVRVDSSANAKAVEDALREMGFTAFGVGTVIDNINSALTGLTVLISLLTGIALVVAAFGIVNTMITSVLERTREIGLWKAVGATDGQVRLVFLAEAGLLGLFGGLLGLAGALLLMIPAESLATDWITRQSGFPYRGAIFNVPMWLMIAGPTLAMLVSMLACLYPASHAARINPVDALRHE